MNLQYKDLGIVTARLEQSRDFYVQQLGFQAVFSDGEYVHLKNGSVELGLMKQGASCAPQAFKSAFAGEGIWISFEVADVDAEHARLQSSGAVLDGPPEDKPWGERCFVVRDPNGLAINLSKSIPADPKFFSSQQQLSPVAV